MGNEIGTVGGAVATVGTSIAAGVTLGQVESINNSVVNTAKYTARHAKNTGVRHIGEAAGSAVGTAGCAIAAGVTLGQVDALNRATKSCADNTGRASLHALVNEWGKLNVVDSVSAIAFHGFTQDLPNERIRLWLAKSASECYDDPPTHVSSSIVGSNEVLRARVYSLSLSGSHKTCLAIRGTDSGPTFGQDLGLAFSGAFLSNLAGIASDWARIEDVDYVTGHSLGGFLAEAVASRLGMDGAAFQSPGGRGLATCFGNAWSTNTRFEVHLNEADCVSMLNCDRHIAEPKWHKWATTGNPLYWHQIAPMVRDIERR